MDINVFSIAVGVLVPLAAAVLTKAHASVRAKANVATALAAAAALLSELTADGFDASRWAERLVVTLLTAIGAYVHVLKPNGVVGNADSPGRVDLATSGFGVG